MWRCDWTGRESSEDSLRVVAGGRVRFMQHEQQSVKGTVTREGTHEEQR